MFFQGSRYAKTPTLEMVDSQGRTIRYKAIRFIPRTEPRFAHRLQRGERLDHIAQQCFRDPEQYWRICDANFVMWPHDLQRQAGATLLIPSAQRS